MPKELMNGMSDTLDCRIRASWFILPSFCFACFISEVWDSDYRIFILCEEAH